MENIVLFWNPKPDELDPGSEVLSQWYPVKFIDEVREYCCMEQYMMAAKAELFGDEMILRQIMANDDPDVIKKLGRKVKNFNSKIWDQYKLDVVAKGNYLKFSQNPALAKYLLSTDDAILAESSPYDQIWGTGLGKEDINARNPEKWPGQNLLGKALMIVRSQLKENK